MMPFSLSSYLLGVGTVVGALAFGFAGGVLLTKTAMKETPQTETRLERVARAESPSTPPQDMDAKASDAKASDAKASEAKAVAAAPADPPAGPASPAQASAEAPKPVAESPKQAEPIKAVESTPQPEPPKPAQQAARQAEQSIKPPDQKEADLRRAEERKIERNKRYAERKARDMSTSRTRPRQFEEPLEPSRRVIAYEREEPRFRLFDTPLFGRSRDIPPFDPDD